MVETAPFVPLGRGRAALAELDRAPWAELAHAYGTGVCGPGRHEDVRACLAQLGDPDDETVEDAVDELFSNVCHQGTIYAATAHAVPFVAAVAADPELWIGHARGLTVLLGQIAIASAFETDDGGSSGSFGEGVAASTRASLHASAMLLSAVGELHPPLADLCTAITSYARTDRPTRADLDAIYDAGQLVAALELGDPPRPTPPAGAEQWVSHPKFGVGRIIAREDAKARVRFTDGIERTLLARVLVPAQAPAPD